MIPRLWEYYFGEPANIVIDGRSYSWESIAAKAVVWFNQEDQFKKGYAKQVYDHLSQKSPALGRSKGTTLDWLKQVVRLSVTLPWLPKAAKMGGGVVAAASTAKSSSSSKMVVGASSSSSSSALAAGSSGDPSATGVLVAKADADDVHPAKKHKKEEKEEKKKKKEEKEKKDKKKDKKDKADTDEGDVEPLLDALDIS